MNEKEMKKLIAETIATVLANKQETKIEKTQPQTQPHKVSEIPQLINKMSVTGLKKTFGTNIFEYKFVGIKDFMTRFNIQSESKYPPRLNYENKHLILEKVLSSYPKKQQPQLKMKAIKTLKSHIKNPPKQLYGNPPTQTQIDKINENYQKEINRWG